MHSMTCLTLKRMQKSDGWTLFKTTDTIRPRIKQTEKKSCKKIFVLRPTIILFVVYLRSAHWLYQSWHSSWLLIWAICEIIISHPLSIWWQQKICPLARNEPRTFHSYDTAVTARPERNHISGRSWKCMMLSMLDKCFLQ